MGNNHTQSNGFVNFYGFISPVITVAWALNTNFARLSWVDNCNGERAYDIYESRNGIDWTLVATTALGANFYDNYTYQNRYMYFRICIHDTNAFSNVVAMRTPLCFWTDQVPVAGLTLDALTVGGAGTVQVRWGDGLFNNLVGANPAFAHVYANPLQYCVQLWGDVDMITVLDVDTEPLAYGDLGKWVLPAALQNLVLTGCAFTGDLREWTLPATLLTLYLDNNLFTGDISGWFNIGGMPAGMTALALTTGNVFTGTVPDFLAGATLPAGLIVLDAQDMGFSGSLRNFLIPAGAAPINISFHACNFGTILRGNYRWVATMNMSENNCSYQEINDFLDFLDSFFSLGVVPLTNFTLNISGAGMGAPSGGAVNNPAIISLTAKYVAAAVVFTIVCN